ncbi:MAG: biopolymer transporter Tol, partial [Melioribacteraceae bacterium]
YELLTTSEADERNPFMTKDGLLYYSSDETGIFNIYSLDLKTKEKKQLTNVVGGAYMPAVNDKNEIAYAGYTASGFKIFVIGKEEQAKVDPAKKYVWLKNPPLEENKPNGDIGKFDIVKLRNYDDTKIPEYTPEKYSGFFSKISILPFIRYDNYSTFNSGLDRIKPGIYIASSDILNRYSIFGSASINRKLERDLFLQFDYRDKLPLFYNIGLRPEIGFELYSVSRGANVDLDFGIDSTFIPPRVDYRIPAEVTYSLFEFDIVAKHKIFSDGTMLEGRFIFSQYSSELGSFILPESGNTLYPASSDKYYIGRAFQLKISHELTIPTIDADINPVGRKVEIKFDYEMNRFNKENN